METDVLNVVEPEGDDLGAERTDSTALFCPRCSNLLLAENSVRDGMKLYCQTCPYKYCVVRPIASAIPVTKKEVDDVLGGAEAWANVDQTEARCNKCGNNHAFFMQIQIRSADEPMTTFYKCAKCGFRWREG